MNSNEIGGNEMNGTDTRIKLRRRAGTIALCFTVASLFLFATIIYPLTSAEPVYAADYEKWEDCDWDGYDDHTGVAVPWVGFDGTRGDTPAGPSPNSQTGKKKAAEEKAKAEAEKKAAAEKKKKEAAAKKKKEEAAAKKKAEAEAKKKAEAEKKAAAAAKETTTTEKAETTKAAVEEEEPTQAAVEEAPVIEEAAAEDTVDLTAAEAAREAAIIETKGTIEVAPKEEGADLHEGSKIVITGTGFYGDVAGIEIEIHSTPVSLGSASSDGEGGFVVTFTLPEGIEAGSHSIVALYKGTELVSAPVEISPAPVSNFLEAFTVGLTGNNPERAPGIIIFIVIVAVGLVTLAVGDARRRRSGATGAADPAAEASGAGTDAAAGAGAGYGAAVAGK
jgi:hypothetical protein